MPSTDSPLPPVLGETLLEIARASIRHGAAQGRPLSVDLAAVPPLLQERRATFVTLERRGELRGCIGRLQRLRPLAVDVAQNAFAAAFRDDRFPPVAAGEVEELDVVISLLSTPEEFSFESEAGLLLQLAPGRDGLILDAGWTRATFLPAVWECLPDPQDFLKHLKLKAGLPSRGLPPGLRAFRFQTECLGAHPQRV